MTRILVASTRKKTLAVLRVLAKKTLAVFTKHSVTRASEVDEM